MAGNGEQRMRERSPRHVPVLGKGDCLFLSERRTASTLPTGGSSSPPPALCRTPPWAYILAALSARIPLLFVGIVGIVGTHQSSEPLVIGLCNSSSKQQPHALLAHRLLDPLLIA